MKLFIYAFGNSEVRVTVPMIPTDVVAILSDKLKKLRDNIEYDSLDYDILRDKIQLILKTEEEAIEAIKKFKSNMDDNYEKQEWKTFEDKEISERFYIDVICDTGELLPGILFPIDSINFVLLFTEIKFPSTLYNYCGYVKIKKKGNNVVRSSNFIEKCLRLKPIDKLLLSKNVV